jgi:hypothetical protein
VTGRREGGREGGTVGGREAVAIKLHHFVTECMFCQDEMNRRKKWHVAMEN